MIGNLLQPTHLLLVLGVILLVMGPRRLPATARSLGRSIRELKGGLSMDETSAAPPQSQALPATAADAGTEAAPQGSRTDG